MPFFESGGGTVTTPNISPITGATIRIRRCGQVVTLTLVYTPTVQGFTNLATGMPKTAVNPFYGLGITSGGVLAESWINVDETGVLKIYANPADLNKQLLFSITYIAKN